MNPRTDEVKWFIHGYAKWCREGAATEVELIVGLGKR
jgi:hypothetical protein